MQTMHTKRSGDTCAEVFEGKGLKYIGNPNSDESAALYNECPNNDTTTIVYGIGGTITAEWDRVEAFRQLKSALHVDAPPRLVTGAAIEPQAHMTLLSFESSTGRDPTFGLMLRSGLSHSTAHFSEQIAAVEAECMALRDWLGVFSKAGVSETIAAVTPSPLHVRTLLSDGDSAHELLLRVRRLMVERQQWRHTKALFAEHAGCEGDVDATRAVLCEMREFMENAKHAAKDARRLSTLLSRCQMLAPAVHEATLRRQCFDEVVQIGSHSLVSGLEDFNDTLADFNARVSQDAERLNANLKFLEERLRSIAMRVQEPPGH